MGGGHFDHNQYAITSIVDEIESIILKRNDEVRDEHGENNTFYFKADTWDQLKVGIVVLKVAHIYAQRIDWLISGDDNEESFHSRLKSELEELGPVIMKELENVEAP